MNTKITVSSAASSAWIPVNAVQKDFKISLGLEVSGTGVYKVEHTFDNPFTTASPVPLLKAKVVVNGAYKVQLVVLTKLCIEVSVDPL